MGIDYKYYDMDKAISKRLDAIFDDPTRHAFYSCFDFHRDQGTRGPRGGQVIGRKRICYYCGQPAKGHAETTEQI